MIVKIVSDLTNSINEMEIPLNPTQLYKWLNGSRTVHQCFPKLNIVQKEFLMTGMTEEEQNEFKDLEEVAKELELEDEGGELT